MLKPAAVAIVAGLAMGGLDRAIGAGVVYPQ